MKKALLTLAAMLTLTGCSDKLIEGKIVGENEIKPGVVQKIIFNVPKGRSYTIQDDSGKFYMAIVTNGEDPLNEGDEGSFKLGEKLFSSSFEHYVDGKRQEHNVTAYKLDEYNLR
ncbi:hypothetical protein HYV49_05425 [Candidatus Pacearchaeota archaeon]|nr:hypothetical protein [Candidatus Pacearchaeota archaeon]